MKPILLSAFIPALASAATSGQFTALTFNVAGLPEILQSNDVNGTKTENAQEIGTYFSEYGYDIIHLQEVRLNVFYLCLVNIINQPTIRTSIIMPTSMKQITIPIAPQHQEAQQSEVVSTPSPTPTGLSSHASSGISAQMLPARIA
jgi:hypothetical protein